MRLARYIYNPIRTVFVAAMLVVVILFAGLYLALSLPQVQNKIRIASENGLSDYLGTNVTIGTVSITPFDQLTLHDVLVPDQQGDSLLMVEKLGAGISLYDLIKSQKLVFTYAELVGLRAHITRPDNESETNLQFIIDRLKPQGDQPPKPFDVQIRNVVIRKCDLTYDVLDKLPLSGKFDVNHISLQNLRADVSLPRIKNDDFDIEIKRLSLHEKSGFFIKNFASHVLITQQQLDVKDIQLELPNSSISLSDICLKYSALNQLAKELPQMSHEIAISNSKIALSDFSAFYPALSDLKDPFLITALMRGNRESINIPVFKLSDSNRDILIDFSGSASGMNHSSTFSYAVPHLKASLQRDAINRIIALVPHASAQLRDVLRRCGMLDVDASFSGTSDMLRFDGDLITSLGHISLDCDVTRLHQIDKHLTGNVKAQQFNLGELVKQHSLGFVAMDADVDMLVGGKSLQGTLDGHFDYIDFKGYRYNNLSANVEVNDNDYSGKLVLNDRSGRVELVGSAQMSGGHKNIDFSAEASQLQINRLGLIGKLPFDAVSFRAAGSLSGIKIEQASGYLDVDDVSLVKGEQTLNVDHISIQADNSSSSQVIQLNSPFLSGTVTGSFDFVTLVPSVKTMLSETFPKLLGAYNRKYDSRKQNNLDFCFTINPSDELQSFVNLPVRVLYKTTLEGNLNEAEHSFNINLNAPYLLQGKKNIIEQTQVTALLDSVSHRMNIMAQTTLPSKKGKIHLNVDASGRSDTLETVMTWKVDRERDFSGAINLLTTLSRNPDNKIRADADIRPSQLVFNDTVWNVQPGKVSYSDDAISVYNLAGQCDKQFVRINGQASHNPDDVLCLQLNDVSLDYVFETLNIDNVMFGGRASGDFYASDLFSNSPRLLTPKLHVENLSYNHAVMGDADIESQWLNESKGVSLKANLNQKNGYKSVIDGAIFIADDSLYLDFNANHANVAFMKPFMQAFTSDVQGEVSGHAVLFGNFHTINLYGDILADSLRFKLDYTNVYYTCSGDSVHMVPNLITFNDVHIHDRDGNEAKMDGWLKHDSFHKPVFNFSITDAKNLLCYDTNEKDNPVWYGTVYGNGAAFVTGEPGVVDIKVNMETAPRSRFTFVLSDAEEANEYNFITFHDRDKLRIQPNVDTPIDTIPEIVRELTAQAQKDDEVPTHYNIDLQGDITPEAQLIIVMDPVGGDQIKATGRGNMRLTYNDADEMTMFGKYILEKGNYNFTLQDIIIKDFTIKDGSSISFQGDPFAAILDIEAVYSLNANIRDLDESFASDKEITRTNVPVHALLRAKGIMSQPDISFDLEFPTLTTDAYRKVRSIISTDEMMNRQIVYLLALNRFYTPDYMNVTTRNNELTSVASSTISSQLSNMLGKMSEKWTISPNFRSEKGDFSDMEVDLALSSQLLNNRLLFNGNFGYRDNTYNTRNSNFIGDFDIEYLLNSKGTLRLKAYNHFNDQNYYVRNALTTQGVGIVWKHDFNSPFDFLHKKLVVRDSVPTDSTSNVTPTKHD